MIANTVRSLVESLKRIPAKLWLRLGALAVLLVGGICLLLFTPVGEYFTQERMLALLEDLRDHPATPFLLMATYAVITPLGFLPVSPLVISIGMIYGPLWGSIYNILGLLLGAMTAYWVAQLLGRDFVVQLAGDRLKRAEKAFERQGFWPLVQIRFLPIPFSVISYGAALAGVKSLRFLVTTALGLVPATLIHTYFGPKLILEGDRGQTFTLYIAALVLLNILVGLTSIRERLRRRRRYRELVAQRAARRN